MARTRSPDYDAIQAQIVERAASLFAHRGYAASSIGDIARACGCSKSRLYHYFGSKESILSFMLADHVDGLLAGCRELSGASPAVDRFYALIGFFMEVYSISRDKHVVLLTCLEFLPKVERSEVLAKERALVQFLRDILAEIRPDLVQDEKAHADTMLFFGMINWTYTWYRADGPMHSADLAERACRLFLDGYLAGAPAGAVKRAGPLRKRVPAGA